MDAGERWRVLRLHVEDHISLAVLARDTGLGLRTLQRWHQRYRTGGITALERAGRADAGQRRTEAALVAFIERLALTRPRPSTATLHRLTLVEARRQGLPGPSYSTVHSIVAALDPALVTLALEGPVSYRDRYELVHRFRAQRPNHTWQADHTQLDILIVGAGGRPERPWRTTVMDDYSRAICGYTVFTGAPSALQTALALRQAIWPKPDPHWAMSGLPEVLYVDHGSDSTSAHLRRTAAELHIRLVHSTVARPQGRGKVERFFGTVNTELLATLPGHWGHSGGPGRGFGSRAPTPVLDLSALDDAVAGFVAAYNQRPHREIGSSSRQAWVGDGWLPRLPDSLQDLDGLLLTVAKHRTVQRDGIHFQGQRYLAPTLAPFVGHRVTIRYDPRDLSEVRVYDGNTFVCVAVDEDHPNTRLSLREFETARRARRHQLRRALNDRIPAVATHVALRASAEAADLVHPVDIAGPAPRRRRLRTYEEDL